jgi:hypothetical protein
MAAFYGRDSDAAWIEECGEEEDRDACPACGGLGDGTEAHVGFCLACGGTGVGTTMANNDWVTFTKRTDDPKLAYLEERLGALHIASRRNGHSFHAPILEVRECDLGAAWDVLQGLVEDADGNLVPLDDLDDDDGYFAEYR